MTEKVSILFRGKMVMEFRGKRKQETKIIYPEKCRGRSMRRNDREIRDFTEIVEVIKKCDVCRIALHDAGYPYMIPLNFGMKTEGEQITLYFHGAGEGKKLELIRQDNRASFEMDCCHELIVDKEGCRCTMGYESVVGRGRMEIVEGEEKQEALRALMRQYHEGEFPFRQEVAERTTVMKLTVEEVTGKRHRK